MPQPIIEPLAAIRAFRAVQGFAILRKWRGCYLLFTEIDSTIGHPSTQR